MSDWAWVGFAYGVVYGVLIGYAVWLGVQSRRILERGPRA